MNRFRFLKHTADLKFRAYGKNIEECFENAGICLSKVIYSGKINSKRKIKFKIFGRDLENLLYKFLEEILFLGDSKHFLINEIKLRVSGMKIEGEFLGEILEIETRKGIKAITYGEMFVRKEKDRWICQVVVDV